MSLKEETYPNISTVFFVQLVLPLIVFVIIFLGFVGTLTIVDTVFNALRPEKPQPVVAPQSDCICDCPNP
jgi:hypothetical protein